MSHNPQKLTTVFPRQLTMRYRFWQSGCHKHPLDSWLNSELWTQISRVSKWHILLWHNTIIAPYSTSSKVEVKRWVVSQMTLQQPFSKPCVGVEYMKGMQGYSQAARQLCLSGCSTLSCAHRGTNGGMQPACLCGTQIYCLWCKFGKTEGQTVDKHRRQQIYC